MRISDWSSDVCSSNLLGPGVAAMDEHRHVRAQAQAQLGQLADAQVQPPEPVQGTQHGGGIGRPAAEPAPNRNAFFDGDIDTLWCFRLRLDRKSTRLNSSH